MATYEVKYLLERYDQSHQKTILKEVSTRKREARPDGAPDMTCPRVRT
jgi:hypothetical protein